MGAWKKLRDALTREPIGFNADGRAIGLGMAHAQEKARWQATEEVEDFLRQRATEQSRSTTSS